MSRKSSRFSSAPIAPQKLSLLDRRRAAKSGRKDAKNYKGLADATLTHALIEIRGVAVAGQHEVNQWLINKVKPLREGNARIAVSMSRLQDQISELSKNPGVSGRQQKEVRTRTTSLTEQLAAEVSQLRMNEENLQALVMAAEEALASWKQYFDAMAAVYVRALSNKLGRDVRSSAAEVPPFESIQVIDVNVEGSAD